MSWRKERSRPERGYHHGNLKEALLQAALGLIAEKGPGGFTFAEAARSAGVSPAAPYRHFRDRDELLSSIAQRGFEQFETILSAAWDDGRPDTITAFERLGRAYLTFARDEPAFYSAMFESGLPADANPALQAASERAFGIIRLTAERLAALTPPGVARPPALMMALHICRCRTASLLCSAAATRPAGNCRCRQRNCLRPACSSTCGGWDFRPNGLSPALAPPKVDVPVGANEPQNFGQSLNF